MSSSCHAPPSGGAIFQIVYPCRYLLFWMVPLPQRHVNTIQWLVVIQGSLTPTLHKSRLSDPKMYYPCPVTGHASLHSRHVQPFILQYFHQGKKCCACFSRPWVAMQVASSPSLWYCGRAILAFRFPARMIYVCLWKFIRGFYTMHTPGWSLCGMYVPTIYHRFHSIFNIKLTIFVP